MKEDKDTPVKPKCSHCGREVMSWLWVDGRMVCGECFERSVMSDVEVSSSSLGL
jgi:formylmethanofuran dehydrogenase subunit E